LSDKDIAAAIRADREPNANIPIHPAENRKTNQPSWSAANRRSRT